MDNAQGTPEKSGPGARRAAALLLALGPELAGPLFRQLNPIELRQIALGARQLRKASPTVVVDALKMFSESMSGMTGETMVGDELLREFAVRSIGAESTRRAFDGVAPPPQPDEVLGPISHADPEALAMVLSQEKPQTIALVLSAIDPERAVAALQILPETDRAEIVRRMAVVESVSPEVLREVGQALATEVAALAAGGMRKVNGKSAALEILRRSETTRQAEMVAKIEEVDPTLAAELKSKLFTFEDVNALSDRDMQALIKDLDLKQLTIALKGASNQSKDKFLKNMSTRAGQMLEDDLSAMGPVRLAEVEAAQAEIAKRALALAEEGRITIVRAADKML